MKKLFLLVSVLFSLFLLSSCTSDLQKVNTEQKQSSLLNLMGKKLQLLNTELYQDKNIHMTINNHKISGFSGCNHFTAALESDEQKFEIKQIGLTRKYCSLPVSNDNPQQLMQTEALFLSLLRSTNRYLVKNNQLRLFDDNKLLLEFAVTINK